MINFLRPTSRLPKLSAVKSTYSANSGNSCKRSITSPTSIVPLLSFSKEPLKDSTLLCTASIPSDTLSDNREENVSAVSFALRVSVAISFVASL